jgi:hypothetical protein
MRRLSIIIVSTWLAYSLCSESQAEVGESSGNRFVKGFESSVGHGATLDAKAPLAEASEAADRLEESDFLIVFRLSPDAMRSFLFKEVNHQGPVNRIIMGTHSTGESITNGKVVVDIVPQSATEGPVLVVRLTGTIHCNTVGRNGPAIIRSRSNSDFVCERVIRFDSESGFVPLTSRVKANPQIHYDDFSSDRGGIRGRIISRAASRRAEESRAQATEIVRSIQEEELRNIFESRLNENIASLNRKLQVARLVGPLLGQRTQLRMAAVAAPEGLKIGFAPADTMGSLPELPQKTFNDAPVEVWLRVDSIAEQPRRVINVTRLAMRALEFEERIQEINVSLSESPQLQPLNFQSTLLQGWIRFGLGQEVEPRT